MNTTELDAQMERLVGVLEKLVAEFKPTALAAANARGVYDPLKAKAVLAAQALDSSSRPSINRAEYVADADPVIALKKLDYLRAEAEKDAAKLTIDAVRDQLRTLQTMSANNRKLF